MLGARIFGLSLVAASALPYAYYVLLGAKMALFVASMVLLFGLAACVRIQANPDTLKGKHILVTGCDSGIGLGLCRRLASHGAVVYAGCLSTESIGPSDLAREHPDNVTLIPMDVTSDAQVGGAFSLVDEKLCEKQAFLWAVVNNAGIQYSGDVELTTMDQARQIMEVNYFGLLRVCKSFIPLLREKPGRLINVSSVRGLCVWPFTGAYAASKFAVEALSDSLRLELARFGVPVVLMEPGHFGAAAGIRADGDGIRREFDAQWEAAEDYVKAAYGRRYVDSLRDAVLASAATSCPPVNAVVDDLVEALSSDAPKDRYFTSGTARGAWFDEYRLMAALRCWIPVSLHDAIVHLRSLSGLPLPIAAAERDERLRKKWKWFQ